MVMKTWSGQCELWGTIQAEEQVANTTTPDISVINDTWKDETQKAHSLILFLSN